MDNENLSKTIDEALEESAVSEQNTSNDVGMKEKVLAIVAHAGWLIAGMGFILLPAVIYLYADKKLPFVAKHAKQALKIQVLSIPVALVVMLCASFAGALMIGYGVLVLVGLLICCLYACYKALNGEEYNYPLLDGNFTQKKAMIAGGVLFFMITTAFISSSGDKKDDDSKVASTSSSVAKSSSSTNKPESKAETNTETKSESKPEPAPAPKSKANPTVTYEEVSAYDMMAALEANPARAKSILLNRNVKITGGRLGFIDSNGDSFALQSGVVTNIRCTIKTKEAADALLNFIKGDPITVYGKVKRVGETLGYSIDVTKLE